MKELIIRILRKLLAIKSDKLLHVIFGIVIAEVVMLLPLSLAAKCVASFVGVSVIEFAKETLIDSKLDWFDVLATEIGCAVGILLTVLNIAII